MSVQQSTTARRRFLLIAIVVLSVILAWRLLYLAGQYGDDKNTGALTVTPKGELASSEKSTIALFRSAAPAVVYITNLSTRRDGWSFDVEKIPKGTGTGFIWDDQGHIVTNYHVIQDAEAANVTLADHTTWPAKLVGIAPDKDLAVLQIKAPRKALKALPVGTSYDLLVGQNVLAIGNPFGLDHTLTKGIISGLGRETQSVNGRPIQDMIQTDAAINPGNSGGPLLDSSGRLIGVNTQIISPSGASVGIGFAVPVDIVSRIVPQLIKHGRIMRPGLGIRIGGEDLARRFGSLGVIVVAVTPDGPAARSGMRGLSKSRGAWTPGDIIVGIDGNQITNSKDLFRALDRHNVGDTTVVTVMRNKQKLDLKVKLQDIGLK
ncbi:MAG TPA: PDZ domain-containing protein [Myxococcales bacterium]|nr:PDZ domain-containing protein [Myxococcales bacterium]